MPGAAQHNQWEEQWCVCLCVYMSTCVYVWYVWCVVYVCARVYVC